MVTEPRNAVVGYSGLIYQVDHTINRQVAVDWYHRFGGDAVTGPTVLGDASEFDFWHTFDTWTPTLIEYRQNGGRSYHVYWKHDGTGFKVTFDYWKGWRGRDQGESGVTYQRVAICVSVDATGTTMRAHEWDPEQSYHTMHGYHREVCARCGWIEEWDSSG